MKVLIAYALAFGLATLASTANAASGDFPVCNALDGGRAGLASGQSPASANPRGAL